LKVQKRRNVLLMLLHLYMQMLVLEGVILVLKVSLVVAGGRGSSEVMESRPFGVE
jgi:hypothetical protein